MTFALPLCDTLTMISLRVPEQHGWILQSKLILQSEHLIKLCDFQTHSSQSNFKCFVSAIRAGGGGDTAEDIMGALKATFTKLSWRIDCCKVNTFNSRFCLKSTCTQVMIHIADAPCHGSLYHNDSSDNYLTGDPAGISHDSMMAEVVRLDLQYWFGYINKAYTDKMISVFNESLCRQSDQRLLIRQFDAVQPAEVSEAVHR